MDAKKKNDIKWNFPKSMAGCVNLSDTEAKTLYKLLYKILEGFGG